MTADEAADLAKRITNTWWGGAPHTEWRNALQPLDPGPAGTTYIRLRNTHEHAPTIHKFLAEYRALTAINETAAIPTPRDGISLRDYLARLTDRATRNTEAAAELDRWRRVTVNGNNHNTPQPTETT